MERWEAEFSAEEKRWEVENQFVILVRFTLRLMVRADVVTLSPRALAVS